MEIGPKQETSSVLEKQKIAAFDMTREFVAERLFSPSTAKFPSSLAAQTTVLKPNHFSISAYVDSQDSLGVTVRNGYTAEMINLGSDWWRLVSLEIF